MGRDRISGEQDFSGILTPSQEMFYMNYDINYVQYNYY